jgi:hexosaminidase
MEAVIDMKEETEISKVSFRFFKGEGQWIYLPKKVSIFVSNDRDKFTLATESTDITSSTKIANPTIEVNSKGRYIKVLIERFGIIPDGLQGGGHEAWLFVDEIIVE